LNFRLAIELKRPPKGLSMAHWLSGCPRLGAGDFEQAEQEFQRAQDVFPTADADAKALAPCNLGYLAVVVSAKTQATRPPRQALRRSRHNPHTSNR